MRYLIFGTLFLVVMGLINYYIYRRFFCRLEPRYRRYAAVVPSLLMLGEIFFILENSLGLLPDSPLLYMICSGFIGGSFILFVVATSYDLTLTVSRKVPFNQERRRFIKLVFDTTMLVAATAYLLRGLSQGLKEPKLNPVTVNIKDFPLESFKILQLSDVHIGRTIQRAFIQRLVERSNAEQPDMVVITGDLVDRPIEEIRDDLAPLAELQAPTYMILGNHEYFHGPEEIVEAIRDLGIRVLLNESVMIGKYEQRFNLVGINDLVGERMDLLPPDVDAAYREVDPERPVIVLAHQPKHLFKVEERRCDLMLSGHTHGGQIFPFGLFVMIDQPYLAGLVQHTPSQQIFISRGTGYWGPPLRVLADSEISLITLKPA